MNNTQVKVGYGGKRQNTWWEVWSATHVAGRVLLTIGWSVCCCLLLASDLMEWRWALLR